MRLEQEDQRPCHLYTALAVLCAWIWNMVAQREEFVDVHLDLRTESFAFDREDRVCTTMPTEPVIS